MKTARYSPRFFKRTAIVIFVAVSSVQSVSATKASELDLAALKTYVIEQLAGSSVDKEVKVQNDGCAAWAATQKPRTPPTVCRAIELSNFELLAPEVKYSAVENDPDYATTYSQTYVFTNCQNAKKDFQQPAPKIPLISKMVVSQQDIFDRDTGIKANIPLDGTLVGSNQPVSADFASPILQIITENDQPSSLEKWVDPYTVTIAKIESHSQRMSVSFIATVIVEADVSEVSINNYQGPVYNRGKLGDILNHPLKIELRGQLTNLQNPSIDASFHSTKVSSDSSACTSPKLPSAPMSSSRDASKIKLTPKDKSMVADLSQGPIHYGISGTSASDGKEVVVPFVEGMSITTADAVANVYVRAQSQGPGFCGVSFSTNGGGSAQIAAPPGVFSDWTVLVSSVGVANFTIDSSLSCDTGIIAEIKYWK